LRDGIGLEILRQHQVEVIVMTSKIRSSAARMKNYKSNIVLGVKDKFAFLTHFFKRESFLAQVGYVGDDFNICQPQTEIVKRHADYILTNPSAPGCDKRSL
jgi:N-acylneuraminate cytidylyltransferase